MAESTVPQDDSAQLNGNEDEIDIPAESEDPEPEKPRVKKAKKISYKKAAPEGDASESASNTSSLNIDPNSSSSGIQVFAAKASP